MQDIFDEALTAGELEDGWGVTVDDADTRSVNDVIESHLSQMPKELRNAIPSGKNPASWAVYMGHTEDGRVFHQFVSSLSLYAVDERGLVSFPSGHDELSWASMLRAVANGYYGPLTQPAFVLIAPAPGIGGNGAFITDLVEWLVNSSPEILIAYLAGTVADESRDRADLHRDRRVRKLAADWATRRIDSPHHLRAWLETKAAWQITEVATRLGLNDAAAYELLASIGFEDTGRGVMTLRISEVAMRLRDQWIGSETMSYRHDLISLVDEDSDWSRKPSGKPGLLERMRRRLGR